jgi:methionyl-tRNA synthetase
MRTMQFGYQCEECEEAVFPATTRTELQWLKNRQHVVREVQRHLSGGLDGWMDEGLEFLDRHDAHSVVLVERKGR